MLAQMARQILDAHTQVEILRDALLREIEARRLEVAVKCVIRPLPLKAAHQRREAVQSLAVKAEDLAYFARREPPAVSAYIGGHRGAELAVALVDILDRFLAIITAWQIQVDVGPFVALLGQEAFKQ